MGYKVKKIYVGTTKVRPAIPIPTSGLLGYRPLQTNLNDASGNGNNGSWYSGTGSFGTVSGKTGARVTTQTSGGWLSTQHVNTSLTYNGPAISFCGWIYFTLMNTYTRHGMMSNSTSSSQTSITVGERPADSGKINVIGLGNALRITDSMPSTNTRYFICVTSNGTTIKAYLNGILVNTGTASGTPNGGIWKLGCAMVNSGYSDNTGTEGYVRHCAVYNRALTDAEVLQFYNNTN